MSNKRWIISNRTARTIPSRRQSWASAFTLVELLVVIGIIALLISILMPALNKARQSSLQVACASNMRQLGVAMSLYCAENKNWFPPNVLLPERPGNYWWPSRLYYYLNRNIEVFRCPAADESEIITGYGTWIELPTYPMRFFPLCYAANIYVGHDMNVGQDPIKITQITKAPETVWLIDSKSVPSGSTAGINTAPFNSHPTDVVPYNSYRHSNRINVLFVDGHVNAYPSTPLSTDPSAIGNLLKWNP
ncbi:MAG: prepilin-type N-terminal cleavage/methylation domain-containing protein [Phycisphaerales bacterium]|nr:prepilin-type N-terminal cleavage/methylation domain-containing protein [Phycisphaerales bacterium]